MKTGRGSSMSCRERSPIIETASPRTMGRESGGPRIATPRTGSRTEGRFRRSRSRWTSSDRSRPERRGLPPACHGLTELHPGEDLDGDDRRNHEVDHEAEGRPPLRAGHETSVVLPEVLQAMTGEADDEQPRRGGDRCGGDEDESAGDAGFDGDDVPASIAADCETDVDGGDHHQSERVDGGRV